ncbi:MAG TPA: hypothetical protein VJ691_09015 [Vicinamibacterales bacterium]|nr:hypothetical protein [Vicinamibacterales bacterium]
MSLPSGQSQDQRPQDSTAPEIEPAIIERELLEAGPEKDDPTGRLEWQRQAWGEVTPQFRALALREGRNHSDKKNARGPRWVNIGPDAAEFDQNGAFTGHEIDSGRARAILPHPTDPDIVYFLTSGGGLWRTKNWTSSDIRWTPLTDDLPTTGGGSVAFGRDPNTLYLGLGDPFDVINVGGAMTKSTNGGNTWRQVIELGSAVSVRDVKVDTSTTTDVVLVATDNGLYRSADNGSTYSAVAAFNGYSVWSIVRSSAGWLVSARPCPPPAANGIGCGSATTLFVSTDRGATWAPITNTGNVFSLNGRTTLGVAVPGDAVVYAYSSTQNDSAMRDVYRSSDGGQTWVANGVNSTKAPTNAPTGSTLNMNICTGQCWYNQSILVDPRDTARNTVWIGGTLASALSTDGGSNWAFKTWWLYSQIPGFQYGHADHHAAAFKATGTPSIILGNDGGFSVSEDDGATFSTAKNRGLVSHLFYTVAGNAQYPNVVIGGTQDNGTRLRTDNGKTYNQVIGGDGMGAAYSQANTNTVIGSSQGSGMRTNLSNQPPTSIQSQVGATGGLMDTAGFGFFTAIVPAPAALDSTGRVFFHFSNSRVWKTENGGLLWTRIASATVPTSPGLPATRRFRSSPYNLGVSPTDLNRIAIGAGGGFLDITTNGGASWTDIDLIAKVTGYQGFVTNVTWQDNRTLWITAVAQAPGAVRVIKGTIANDGDSWAGATFTPMQDGLPDLPVTRVYIDPRDPSKQTLYAATHVGVYRTVDGGESWHVYSNGLPTVRVNDIYMSPDGSFMRIATYGRGIWELSQMELVNTTLVDDSASCDQDGVLDNGETGTLYLTFANQGPNNLNHIELTVTTTNPNVTFPFGTTVNFPPLQKAGTSTGSIRVALNGAAGVETADFQISIVAPELELASGLNVTARHRVNYNEVLAASTTETVESPNHGWTIAGDPEALPNITTWQRRALSPTDHVWFGPDNNGQVDDRKPSAIDQQMLVSPVLHVGAGALTMSFRHRFAFEGGGWDGGVIEISTDGGATWSAVAAPYNGLTNAATTAPIGAARPAFVNRSAGWPNFANVSINLGAAYANQEVRIRFRIGADEFVGAPGWDIDDIAFGGLANTPFTLLAPQPGVCTTNQQ